MTYEEARNHFKLKPNDKVYRKGVLQLLTIAERQLKNAPYYSRREREAEVEALKLLLEKAI